MRYAYLRPFLLFLYIASHRIPFSLIRYSLFIYSIKFTGISVNAMSFVGYLLLYSMIPVYCCNSSQIFSCIKCNFSFTQRIIQMTNAMLALERSQRYIANQVTHKILSYSCIYRVYRIYRIESLFFRLFSTAFFCGIYLLEKSFFFWIIVFCNN